MGIGPRIRLNQVLSVYFNLNALEMCHWLLLCPDLWDAPSQSKVEVMGVTTANLV